TTTGSGVACGDLLAAFRSALATATECNACALDQCSVEGGLKNECDCPVAAVNGNSEAAQRAKTARAAWLEAGCGPLDCGCTADASYTCIANADSCYSHCTVH